MKRSILLFIAFVALTACQTTGGTAPSLADIQAKVCPPVKAVLVVLENSPTVDTTLRTRLQGVEPLVFIACSGEIKADAVSLHELADQALPVLLEVIAAAPLSDDQKNAAILGIAVAQAAISAVR